MGYLGYDPCGLGVLLGALESVALERLAASDPRDRSAVDAVAWHRRIVAAVAAFAQPVGAVLHGDPLGRFRPVDLDPGDLRWWAFTRGGRWRTVADPTHLAGPRLDPAVVNARLVAAQVHERDDLYAWMGDGHRAPALLAYLHALTATPTTVASAGRAFLEALGPDGLRDLLDALGARFDTDHQSYGPDPRRAVSSLGLLDAIGRLWAELRAAGVLRSTAWDRAALGGRLTASSRLLAVAAATPGALDGVALARWGTTLWSRLAEGVGTGAAPQPEHAADDLMAALVTDGRAARRFVLDLGDRRDRGDPRPLLLLLADVVTGPERCGALLLASTDPSSAATAADDRDVGRSMQIVLRAVAALLERHDAGFPAVGRGEAAVVATGSRTLPTDLGLYVGRYLPRLVDACDGARTGRCTVGAPAGGTWAGWHEREVARLLGLPGRRPPCRRAARRRRSGKLRPAGVSARPDTDRDRAGAGAGRFRRGCSRRRPARPRDRARRVRRRALRADRGRARPRHRWCRPGLRRRHGRRRHQLELGRSRRRARGCADPGPSALTPFEPRSVRDTLAGARSDEALRSAVLEPAVATIAVAQLRATGADVAGAVPPLDQREVERIEALQRGTRPGANANAAGVAELDGVERWLAAQGGSPAAVTVRQLMAAVAAAAARGAAWSA